MVKVEGKNGISATVIADSTNSLGNRMITMELVFPRPILAELNTHKMLSKNSQSSRAVPLTRALEYASQNGFVPVWWGKNQSGMSAKEELSDTELSRAQHLWESCKQSIMHYVAEMGSANLHKQIAARPLEAFQMHKAVVSGTEWANLVWLRDHEDAQPEFAELARCITEAINQSTPFLLHPGEWHLPYVETKVVSYSGGHEAIVYLDTDGNEIDLETARKISASCCAQVSYRKLDDSVEKAIDIFNKLFSGSRIHASPVEHQATPMAEDQGPNPLDWEFGVTHVDRKGNYWSANLQGFIQYRKLIPNEAKWD
jgi:hypothetical protein